MIGIDEVGRGPWAGPLVVCALRLHAPLPGLADSKKLSAQKRQKLYAKLAQGADIGLGWVSAEELDDIGLSLALKVAASKALSELDFDNNEPIISDGTVPFFPGLTNEQTVIKADSMYPCVSGASIVAKVLRDERMAQWHQHYPRYGFDRHAGYGTAYHRQAIIAHGLTPLHRRSFTLPEPKSDTV